MSEEPKKTWFWEHGQFGITGSWKDLDDYEAWRESEDQKLREQIANEILVMDCPSISGEFVDSWVMFRHVRNKAVDIAKGKY